MKLKLISETDELLFEHNGTEISDEDSEKIEAFNQRETISHLILFESGVKLEQTHDFYELKKHSERIKEVIVKIK